MNKLMRESINVLLVMLLLLSAEAFAQSAGAAGAEKQSGQSGGNVAALEKEKSATETINVMRDYRGIHLGMSQDEVRKVMGKPDRNEKMLDEFKLEKDDLMTVRYENGVVNVIQLYFTDEGRAPEFAEVVGEVELTQKDNGARFARRAITDEKFWISMYQSGDKKITTVTIAHL